MNSKNWIAENVFIAETGVVDLCHFDSNYYETKIDFLFFKFREKKQRNKKSVWRLKVDEANGI